MGPKVPHLRDGVMNLLKVVDLPTEDQIGLIKMGFGDILQQPGTQTNSQGVEKERLDLRHEYEDDLKAQSICFKFICYKTAIS